MRILGSCVALVVLLSQSANADFIVAPNANTNASGNSIQLGVLDAGNVTFQFAYAASQFSGISTGTAINGIGFRLFAGDVTQTTALIYSQFSIEVATSAVAVGSLSSNFAANESSDNTVVRSGALTIAAGSLVGGAGPNPFFEINFTTPFVYKGGSLVITLRHTSPGVTQYVDANTINSSALPITTGNSVASFDSTSATTGTTGFYNVPVTSFYYSPSAVPEPASLTLLGMGAIGLVLRLRR